MRTLEIAKRIIMQLKNDHRTLGLLLVAPMVVLTLISIVFSENEENKNTTIGYYNVEQKIVDLIKEEAPIVSYDNASDIEAKIKDDNLTAFIYQENDDVFITYEGFNLINTGETKRILTMAIAEYQISNVVSAVDKLQNIVKGVNPNFEKIEAQPITIEQNSLYLDDNSTFFDSINPILINFFVFFFVFIISGVSLINERTSDTLERLMATPIKRYQVVLGYIMGYGSIAIIQTLLIVTYAIYILDITVVGSIWLILLINILTALIALTLGILLSSFAKSEFQIIQFVPLVIIPQVFFTNIMPVENMSEGLQTFASFLPLYYSGTAIQEVMIKGYGISDIAFSLMVISSFIVILTFLTIMSLKKFRKI